MANDFEVKVQRTLSNDGVPGEEFDEALLLAEVSTEKKNLHTLLVSRLSFPVFLLINVLVVCLVIFSWILLLLFFSCSFVESSCFSWSSCCCSCVIVFLLPLVLFLLLLLLLPSISMISPCILPVCTAPLPSPRHYIHKSLSPTPFVTYIQYFSSTNVQTTSTSPLHLYLQTAPP